MCKYVYQYMSRRAYINHQDTTIWGKEKKSYPEN